MLLMLDRWILLLNFPQDPLHHFHLHPSLHHNVHTSHWPPHRHHTPHHDRDYYHWNLPIHMRDYLGRLRMPLFISVVNFIPFDHVRRYRPSIWRFLLWSIRIRRWRILLGGEWALRMFSLLVIWIKLIFSHEYWPLKLTYWWSIIDIEIDKL